VLVEVRETRVTQASVGGSDVRNSRPAKLVASRFVRKIVRNDLITVALASQEDPKVGVAWHAVRVAPYLYFRVGARVRMGVNAA
jgi:hypothetical protein